MPASTVPLSPQYDIDSFGELTRVDTKGYINSLRSRQYSDSLSTKYSLFYFYFQRYKQKTLPYNFLKQYPFFSVAKMKKKSFLFLLYVFEFIFSCIVNILFES